MLEEFGELLGQKLGLSAFAGNMLMGFIFSLIILFPLIMVSRRKGGGFIMEAFFGISVFAVNCAVGWWPWWMLITLSFLVAMLWRMDS